MTTLPASAQDRLDRYIEQLCTVLASADRPQREACTNLRFDEPERPDTSAIGGDPLRAMPFRPAVNLPPGTALVDAMREVGVLSRAEGVTIRQIELRFAAADTGWQHTQHVETLEQFRQLTDAREQLDQDIAGALVKCIEEDYPTWQQVSLAYAAAADATRPGLHVLMPYPRPITVLPPTPTLRKAFAGVVALHERFGRRLHTASWRVDSKRPQRVDVATHYG
ncbi:MAG: hypothetical protein WKG01_39680 [Kofleriaceae bacterium]